ncbi:hypothetical protein AB0I60_08810 [Actinosynnema sp. NPDC050436]|uniref:hypothetical protein n=1 Tax=Actinosynnema sp. NPDC050436 TaxID=3155659 RepID=UPI0033FB77FD
MTKEELLFNAWLTSVNHRPGRYAVRRLDEASPLVTTTCTAALFEVETQLGHELIELGTALLTKAAGMDFSIEPSEAQPYIPKPQRPELWKRGTQMRDKIPADTDMPTVASRGLAEKDAPLLFAVGLEYGDRHYAEVAAYGMAFDGYTEAISRDGTFRVQTTSPEDVLRYFVDESASAHVVWLPKSSTANLDSAGEPSYVK